MLALFYNMMAMVMMPMMVMIMKSSILSYHIHFPTKQLYSELQCVLVNHYLPWHGSHHNILNSVLVCLRAVLFETWISRMLIHCSFFCEFTTTKTICFALLCFVIARAIAITPSLSPSPSPSPSPSSPSPSPAPSPSYPTTSWQL